MPELLTPAQVAERLQVKKSWVYEQTRTRGSVRNPDPLPHIQMAGIYGSYGRTCGSGSKGGTQPTTRSGEDGRLFGSNMA
jgi:hypothetical protein